MNQFLIKVFLSVLLAAVSFCANAQDVKLGYVDMTYIYDNLPENQALVKELEASSNKYREMINEKFTQYQTKTAAYEKLVKEGASSVILSDKQRELQKLQDSIEDFKVNADKEIKSSYESKFRPIQGKVDKAINEYAAANKFTYVFRMQPISGSGETVPFILYSANGQSDLSKSILSKLGVTSPTKAALKPILGLQAGLN